MKLIHVLVVPVLAVGSGVASLPALATPSTAGSYGVTLMLAPQDRAGLEALASKGGGSRSWRLAQLSRVGPSAHQAADVSSIVEGMGLHVQNANRFTVRISGSKTLVTSIFGSTRDSHGIAGKVRLRIPAALRGLVSSVAGGDDRAARHQPRTTPDQVDGARARNLYAVTNAPLPDGQAAPTIATLQFSGFDSSDLTMRASQLGLPDPVASGQYNPISVDDADPTLDDGGGDEVAMDQESLLDTAPQANQNAYYLPNGQVGATADGISQVTSDATTGTNGGATLMALSTSWGGCESETTADDMATTHDAIANLLAAGITFFGPAGDDGAFDCSKEKAPAEGLAVDYPASDPYVVAVGGTEVAADNSQTTWWEPTGETTGYLGSGTGGGYSKVWGKPSYQASTVTGSFRAIPDIALDASSNSPYPVVYKGEVQPTGGTSLATPFAAATLTDLLMAHGGTYGVGNILPNLYEAPDTGFTDITSGSNGYYEAGPGYDLASGLGAPLWEPLFDSINSETTLANRPLLGDKSSSGNVTLTVWTDSTFAGKSVTFYVRSGTSGKVRPLGQSIVNNKGIATRFLHQTRGQSLALYCKLQGVQDIQSPYSNTVRFRVQ